VTRLPYRPDQLAFYVALKVFNDKAGIFSMSADGFYNLIECFNTVNTGFTTPQQRQIRAIYE
jgi:hypothetical protein